MKHTVLVVEDDRPTRLALEAALQDDGYSVTSVASGEAAIRQLQSSLFSAVICDVILGEGLNGVEVLRKARLLAPDTVFIMVTGFGSVESAVQAIKLGAFDYFTKPVELERLGNSLTRGIDGQKLAEENHHLKNQVRERFSSTNIIGRSQVMTRLMEDLERIAVSDSNVLVTGESGVGKELFVSAVHRYSPRVDQPMIRVNCPALAEGVLESELFGHEKGAFTGATNMRRGRFEMAHKGTLFLDEIGELGRGVQAKLLRALEQRTVERVGSSQPLSLDVRVVAATNRDVEREVARGHFRADLYYRLSVFRLHIPPLRERAEDIPLLVDHFVQVFNARNNTRIRGVSATAMEALNAYSWPGNIRELRNYIERAMVLTRTDIIDIDNLPRMGSEPVVRKLSIQVGTPIDEVERQLVLATLDAHRGNKARAARALGISLRTLYRRLETIGVPGAGAEE